MNFFSLFSGYLGYTSGFSLSCMVFFLTAVSFSSSHTAAHHHSNCLQGAPFVLACHLGT